MNDDDHSANRILAVTLGGSVAAVCSFFAWGAFALLTMTTSPALAEGDYWSAVREQAGSNPVLAVTAAAFGLGAVASVGLTIWSLARRGRRGG